MRNSHLAAVAHASSCTSLLHIGRFDWRLDGGEYVMLVSSIYLLHFGCQMMRFKFLVASRFESLLTAVTQPLDIFRCNLNHSTYSRCKNSENKINLNTNKVYIKDYPDRFG